MIKVWSGFVQLIPLLAALFAVWLTNHYSQRNRRRELRQKAYARLAGAEATYLQAMATQLQAQLDAQIFVSRASSAQTDDFKDNATKSIEFNWSRIEKLAEARRDLWEALADVRVAFFQNSQLQAKVSGFMSPTPWSVSNIGMEDPKTHADFLALKTEVHKQIAAHVHDDVKRPLDAILEETLAELRRIRG
jgi:hypothetical protein